MTRSVALGVVLTATTVFAQDKGCSGTAWSPPIAGEVNSLGSISTAHKDYRLQITVVPAGDPLRFSRASCVAAGESKTTSTIMFNAGSRQVEVTVSAVSELSGRSTIEFTAPQLSVASVAVSKWPEALEPKEVNIPYYQLPITWLPRWQLFSNVYFDWTASNASGINPSSAVYEPLTNGIRNTLHERIVARFNADFDGVLPDISNPKSPYMSSLAGRLVYDLTGGPPFALITTTLNKLKGAGLKNCVVIIHSWVDNRYLPAHDHLNPRLGGEAALAEAIQAGEGAGCYVALHENYIDYYPMFPRFDPSAIAIDSAGQRQKGWYDKLKLVQSFHVKPTLIMQYAAEEATEVQRKFRTNASYIDVNSAYVPWRVPDMDASVPGAGLISPFAKASTALWQLERTIHNGPVFGEGNRHWFWSGLLDGVEAQFGFANIPIESPRAPLFVNFDLLKIHPLEVNHGMGYTNRWVPKGQDYRQMMLLDAYRMQEIAFGHAPYIDAAHWNDLPQVLIEQNLIGSVAQRYGTQTASTVQYEVGEHWSDTNAAVSANDWSRVKVQYSNGDTVVANSRPQVLQWNGIVIPQNGWAATGFGLRAYTALINGQLADYSETETSLFANSRNMSDMVDAKSLIFQPDTAQPQSSEARLNSSGSVVDFGPVQTDGMVSISRAESQWTLRAYPPSRNVIVRLSAKRFPVPRSVACDAGTAPVQIPSVANGYWTVTTKGSNYCAWQ